MTGGMGEVHFNKSSFLGGKRADLAGFLRLSKLLYKRLISDTEPNCTLTSLNPDKLHSCLWVYVRFILELLRMHFDQQLSVCIQRARLIKKRETCRSQLQMLCPEASRWVQF